MGLEINHFNSFDVFIKIDRSHRTEIIKVYQLEMEISVNYNSYQG